MHRHALAALLAAALLTAAPAAALSPEPSPGDQVVVTLASGLAFRGTLVSRGERTLRLRSTAGSVRDLPLASVKEVTYEGPGAAVEPAAAEAPVGAATVAAATPMTPDARPAPTAQPSPAPEASATGGSGGAHVGLGVSLNPAGSPVFYVPIQLGSGFRVEPEIGFLSLGSSNSTARVLQLGVGLLATGPVEPQVGWYGGLRIQVRTFGGGGQGYDRTESRLALVGGAEWQPLSRVALGVEAQLGYESADGAGTQLGLGTASLAFLRIYLN